MPKFEKGISGNRTGRPKGLKDKRQFSLTFWFDLLLAEYPRLKPSQRSKIALDCWKTLIHKSNSLPSDPQESVMNVTEAQAFLKEIEKTTRIDIVKESKEVKQ